MKKTRSTSRTSLKGQIVYAVELRTWEKNGDGGVRMESLLSYLATSWKDAESFIKDPSEAAGEKNSWWHVLPTVIGEKSPVYFVKPREARSYDLRGRLLKDKEGLITSPTVEESKARRFQGVQSRTIRITARKAKNASHRRSASASA